MDHFVEYGSTKIEFELAFADRKTLGITVHPDRRVVVTAPLDSELQKIREKVRKRAAWITKQQRFFLGFEPKTPPRRFVSGESHFYLGRQYRLKIIEGEEESIKLSGGFFWARTQMRGEVEKSNEARRLLEAWYKEKAGVHFPRIAAPYLSRFVRLGVEPTDFIIRKMDKRWGSCTAAGKVILNTELIRAPRGCIEYVVVHELCHLLHHDHGAKFQALQAAEFPAWEKWKRVLEEKMV